MTSEPELRLPCRSIRCSKCCIETQMELSEDDIRRLERLGYKRDDFAVCENGSCRLRNVNGRCYFLGENGCRVYEHRPLGCRIYPVVCVEGEGLAVDAYCPLALVALRKLREDAHLVKSIAEAVARHFRIECPARVLGLIDSQSMG